MSETTQDSQMEEIKKKYKAYKEKMESIIKEEEALLKEAMEITEAQHIDEAREKLNKMMDK